MGIENQLEPEDFERMRNEMLGTGVRLIAPPRESQPKHAVSALRTHFYFI
jgi:hypothetical protein